VAADQQRQLEQQLSAAVESAEREKAAAVQERRSVADRVARALAAEEQARRECRKQVEASALATQQAQGQAAEASAKLKEQQAAAEEAKRKFHAQLHDAQAAQAKADSEAGILRQKVERLSAQCASAAKQHEDTEKLREQDASNLRSATARCAEAEHACQEAKASAQGQGEALLQAQKEYASLVAAMEQQRLNRQEAEAAAAKDFESERAAALASARRQHDSLRAAAASALEKERRRTAK
jgi:hypothetical protein